MFRKIKNEILGREYSLSVGFISSRKSRMINKKYRGKDKATNVLAFPLAKSEGEILLCPSVIASEAKKSKKTYQEWEGFLVIHGMLHLKGMRHGGIMEKAEKKYYEKYLDRNRSRIGEDARRRRRISKGRKIS